jgi:hypothetical protein
LIAVVVSVVCLSLVCGCSKSDPEKKTAPQSQPTDNVDFKMKARVMVKAFATELKGTLIAAMKKGGPPHAIDACAKEAPKIAARHSAGDLTIRRVGTRVRNKKTNTPSPKMRDILNSLSADRPERILSIDNRLTYIRAITIQNPVCLNCHGKPGRLHPGIKETLARLYPDDDARGYEVGDLRGAFVVEEKRP